MPRGGWGGVGSAEVELLLRWVQRALVASTENNGYMILKNICILSCIPIISSDESKELFLPAPMILVVVARYGPFHSLKKRTLFGGNIRNSGDVWILVLIMSMMRKIINIMIMMLIFMITTMMIILLCSDNTGNTYLSPPPPRFLRSKGELSRVLMSWRSDVQKYNEQGSDEQKMKIR